MTQTDETIIRQRLDAWAQAVRDANMEGIVAHHTEDIVMFDVPVPLQSRGLAAYRATWELFFTYSPDGPPAFNIVELEVTVGGDVAYAHGILSLADSRLRLTVGLRREAGQWRIAHEHHSFPQEIG